MLLTCIPKLSAADYSTCDSIKVNYVLTYIRGLADAVVASDGQVYVSQLGKKVILPLSFTGGPRYQHQLYQDAMSIVCHFGKPDFFVTYTCNPRWQEITDALLPGQTAENRQDIVARVFKLKLKSLLHDLFLWPKTCLRQDGCINICY